MAQLIQASYIKEFLGEDGFVKFPTLRNTHDKLVFLGFQFDCKVPYGPNNVGFMLYYTNRLQHLVRIKTHGDGKLKHPLYGQAHLSVSDCYGGIYEYHDEVGKFNADGDLLPNVKDVEQRYPRVSNFTNGNQKSDLKRLKDEIAGAQHFQYRFKNLSDWEWTPRRQLH